MQGPFLSIFYMKIVITSLSPSFLLFSISVSCLFTFYCVIDRDSSPTWRNPFISWSNNTLYCHLIPLITHFSCLVCKYTVHERCVQRCMASCITTYSKKKTKGTPTFQHHWTEGNCYGRCSKCRKRIKAYHGITGLTCRWCRMTVSISCRVDLDHLCCCCCCEVPLKGEIH